MEQTTDRLVVVVAVASVVAAATGPIVAARAQENLSEPPGVTDGNLTSPSTLLAAHTSALTAVGFTTDGGANVTIVRRGVLVDVQRSANRTVVADATEYRQTQWTVADAAVASIVRNRTLWGNESVEAFRTDPDGRTTYAVRRPKSPDELTSAARLRPYLLAANYTVTDVGDVGGASAPAGVVGGDVRYTLSATSLANATRMNDQLPDGSSDPRNFSAELVVDEDGRVHGFDASVTYTILGSDRTHTISFALRGLAVSAVARPPWVADALATADAVPGNATATDATTESSGTIGSDATTGSDDAAVP